MDAKSRTAAANRRYYAKNKAEVCRKSKIRDRLIKTGWTQAMYEQARIAQGGRCGICGAQSKKELDADHCHATLVRRMLLCRKCNTALGLMGDSPAQLEEAASYIRRFRPSGKDTCHMALKDRYNAQSTIVGGTTTPGTTIGEITQTAPSAVSASPPPAPDLAAVRARLAQRQSPGVNPPEAEIPPTAFDRTTEELADGSVISLPDAASPASSGTYPTPDAIGGELTRGQKAAATRAANKERKPRGAATATSTPETPVSTMIAQGSSAKTADCAPNASADRIAAALERIACALEEAGQLPPVVQAELWGLERARRRL